MQVVLGSTAMARCRWGALQPSGLGSTRPLRAARIGPLRRCSRVQQRSQCSAAAVENPFKYPRDMDGLQSALAGLPTAGVYVLGAALAAGLGGAGFVGAGAVAPEGVRQAARVVAGAAGAALGAFLTAQLKAKRQSAAIIELSNLLVEMGDPTALTREQVAAIEAKYGASLAATNPDELKSIYGAFLEAVVPPGDAPLTGSEPVLIQAFKAALALSDVDAAPAHIEVGRRILRGRMEAGSRADDVEARKTFQKLIYVSNLVFGDRQAAFLLPWTRVFGLTEAQASARLSCVYVAKRDNAKGIFKQYLDSHGGQLQADKAFLVGLRQAQAAARLADDEAAALVKEAARARVEELLESAVKSTKQRTRTRDYTEAMAALTAAVAFNRGLAALSSDPEVIAGVGPTSVLGGAWEAADGRSKDTRELFKIFLEERLLSDGAFTDGLEADAAQLRTLMGLGNKECADIEADVKQAAYKRLLREEVTTGRLAAAESKAEVLGDLVERVRFDADAARAFHEALYRQKLASLLEKKKLTEEDDVALREMQVQLCIQNEERDRMHAELCGALFKDAVTDALAAGIDGFGFQDRQRVQQAFKDLRLERPAARASRNTRNRLDAAKELKKLVFFSNIVVAPLVEDLKTEEEKAAEEAAAKQQKEMMELMKKAQEEAAAKAKAEGEAAAAAPAAAADAAAAEVAPAAEAAPAETAGAAEAEAAAAASPSEGGEDGAPEAASAAAEAEVKEILAEATAAAAAEEAEEAAAAAAAAKVKSLEKAEVAAAARAGGEAVGGGAVMRSQKDVTLAEDLDLRDRTDIYKNFLLYCMTGDVVQGPMGVTMVTGGWVHTGMAEQAFKQQVQGVLGDGMLTPDRAAALEKMREQMGLPRENADKIIRGFTNQKAIAGMQSLKAQGRLTLDKVLEIKEAGVDVASLLGEDARAQLYRTEVVERLSDGTGDFSAERMLRQLPEELGIDAEKAARTVAELGGERKRTTLVQAISFLRQKKVGEAAKALNNLVSCEAAVPSDTPADWQEREELADLFSAYVSKEPSPEKQAVVQKILGLGDGEADALRSIVEAGGFKVAAEEAEEAAFF
ncbi:hypothetical protein CHLNCDRAFT_139027 [Chlorella variabilis]|uniref:Uncharacterized protein n=1 Tax=Chlorella variabilis TaxID=554065 RepID=E1ZPM7_CHLVA|nr:hypothetical protein CHLNCDRAFT_139027 [Chlorella variabilis]EFN52285.1 hypothetical protein CHLNCDRAFT_139027 [Chlorella variabilis]|eukprot:XP_005844387.1 hypothetical protein CHLNCDRAFT_139027 [Chlorella variabilis]